MAFGKSLKKAFKPVNNALNKYYPKRILANKILKNMHHLRHKYGLTRSILLPSSSLSQSYNATGSDIYGPTGSIASKFAVNH